MHHSLAIMAVYLLPTLFIYCQGSPLNIGDQKLILVDSSDYDISSGPRDLGIGSCIYTGTRQYSCSVFDEALVQLVEDNTIVAINSSVTLESVVFSNITNLSIIGYNKKIEIFCEFPFGSVRFENCNNITIENISWNQCGHNFDDTFFLPSLENIIPSFDKYFFYLHSFGLSFIFCTNINLKSCTFKDSMIEIYNTVSGAVCIDQIHFLSTDILPTYELYFSTPLATGLIMHQDNQTKLNNNMVVKITNSLFSQVNSTINGRASLLLYIFVDDPNSTIQVFINQSNFSSVSYNPGWRSENGMFWIRILSCKDAYIKFFEVKFQSNKIRSAYNYFSDTLLHIDITTFRVSRNISRILIDSCSFLSNSAKNIAYFEGDMYLNIINTNFSNNKANTIIFVTTSFYNDDNNYFSRYNDIYITTAVQVLQCTFFNNTGDHLMSLNGEYILIIISEVQITHNILIPGYGGLIMFQNYSTIIANITNIEYHFNCIKGDGSGFHFTSKSIVERYIQPQIYLEFRAIIPPYFQFAVQGNYLHSNYQWFTFTNGSFINNTGGGHGAIIHFAMPQLFSDLFSDHSNLNNMISTSVFNHNSGFASLIYASTSGSEVFMMVIEDCTFMHNTGSVFYLQNQILQFLNRKTSTVFDNNRAQNGAALYLDLNSVVRFTKNSAVTFSNNVARRYGGAIYYDITQLSEACYKNLSVFKVENNSTSIDFRSNVANIAGNSIYFSVSQSCNATLRYDFSIFDQQGDIITSPNHLRLYYPAQLVNSTNLSTYYVSDIMLGQNIIIPACVLGYYGIPAGSVQFTVKLVDYNNDQNYSVAVSNLISVDCNTLQGINLVITGSRPLNDISSTLTIQLNSFYDSRFDWKPITVNLNVQLSSCHSGFHYSSDLERCVCYTTDNIVTCSDSNSTIRNSYWFGVINEQPTVTICPINYCNFDNCEATTGTCNLYPLRDNQCRGHRSGVACGNCEEGYTLSFDSIECIATEQCTTGQTVLVITMSFLYWIAVIVVVFCMMYFKIGIGYLYGITFFYSIIDVVLGNTILSSDSLYQLVTTLSSVAKLLPQFLGRLCFVKGLSGIDQQFIHYLHPLAILLMLALISISTRYSPKLSLFVSRAVIHSICLLLLLSYSSIASTSLLLVRALTFTNVDKVYSYLSPDIGYFHGRHLVYGLMAILIGLVIVIGLPLLLLLEPFLNSKINFIKIKPLLDQFQGCYKDKCRYFASYFLIFRLMILGILAINTPNSLTTFYSLEIICLIMILIHVTVKPYSNNLLNFFDSFMLCILVLVISFQIVEIYGFSPSAALGMAFVSVILPLFVFLLIVVYLHVENIKKLIVCLISIKSSKSAENANNEATEMHQCELIVDQTARDKVKTTVV